MEQIVAQIVQFFYNLINSQYFGTLLIIWIAVDVIWVGKWQALFVRVGKLLRKPWVFTIDENPEDPPLYPRRILEQLAQRKSGGNQQPGAFNNYVTAQIRQVFDPEHPLRTIGYGFFLALFVFFLVADAISVAQTLSIMGILNLGDLPPIFDRFDFAVLAGAVLAAIVGVWVFVEVLGDGEFINTHEMKPAQRVVLQFLSILIAIFAVIVMIAFAIERLTALGILEATPTSSIILASILYGLVPINSALAAAICFPAAAKGLVVLLFLVTSLIIGILPVLVCLIDFVWRAIYILLDVAIWAIVTPFMVIPFLISWLIKMLTPTPVAPALPDSEPKLKSKKNGD